MWTLKTQVTRLKRLQAFADVTSRGNMQKEKFFVSCLRASFAKSYELCVEAYGTRKNQVAFFLVPNLRSICEDLIVLAYIARLPKVERDKLTALLMQHELVARLESQAKFFSTARPDQPVLSAKGADIASIEDAAREIWKKNGWPGLSKAWMPPVRQIAEKHHVDLLTTLYDYIYRLTSGMVHFNPQVLLRSGWGKPPNFHFSPKNFHAYYLAFARTYSLLLFCLYFELFNRFLMPDRTVRKLVGELRKDLLLEPRWPEMITYEEMNLEPPKGQEMLRLALRVADAEAKKRKLLSLRTHTTTPSASGLAT